MIKIYPELIKLESMTFIILFPSSDKEELIKINLNSDAYNLYFKDKRFNFYDNLARYALDEKPQNNDNNETQHNKSLYMFEYNANSPSEFKNIDSVESQFFDFNLFFDISS